jgi:hypothetical protein
VLARQARARPVPASARCCAAAAAERVYGIMASTHAPPGRSLRYKFVELSLVTDESLERAVNEWVAQGWELDRIHFVTNEASRRPAMAFVGFVREVDAAEAAGDGPAEDGPGAGDDAETHDPR